MKRPGVAPNMTAAQREAEAAFKMTLADKQPSDDHITKKAFDENRERLKALRLARDASNKADQNDEEGRPVDTQISKA